MGEPHLLQRLVYVESEEYERRKEAAAQNAHSVNGVTPARHSDLVVYFIKHLVRITARRNSFYVTLGLSRLLYNYSTPETMELYNLIIQDPDRVHDDYYYRSRKGILLKELKERFGELVEVSKGTRGELRWRPSVTRQHHQLAAECLRWFTPWATACVVPEQFDPLSDQIEPLNFKGRHPDEEHEVEVSRIHAAIHPDCYARLASVNRFPRPEERLELPHFFLSDSEDDFDNDSRTPPSLSNDELQIINELLSHEATRRKNASTGFLSVQVDGVQQAQINVKQAATAWFQVGEEAELVEVYTSDQQGSLLLATHLLNLCGPRTQVFTITTEGGQRITFTINLRHDESGADVSVAVKESVAFWRELQSSLLSVFGAGNGWLKPVAALALLLLICVVGWWALTNRPQKNDVIGVVPIPGPTLPDVSASPTPSPLLARRQPDPRVERRLIANVGTNAEPDEFATRGAWNPSMGKPLHEISKIYLQPLADNDSTSALQTDLRARLASGPVSSSPPDQADAALKIRARKADGSRVLVTVRLVSESGYVVWPDTRRSSSWQYIGKPSEVVDRIAQDLTRAIAKPQK